MARPAVLFPDAVTAVIVGLSAAFVANDEGAPAVNEVPVPRPDRFLTVRRLGGPRRDLVTDTAQLAFEAWETSMIRAQDFAQLARALVRAMAGTVVDLTALDLGRVSIGRIDELAGPHELPDPITELPRYAFSEIVAVRGVAL